MMGKLAVLNPKTGKYEAPKGGEFPSRDTSKPYYGKTVEQSTSGGIRESRSAETGAYIPEAVVTSEVKGTEKNLETMRSQDKAFAVLQQQKAQEQVLKSQQQQVEQEQQYYSTGYFVEEKKVTLLPGGEVKGEISRKLRVINPGMVKVESRGKIPVGVSNTNVVDKSAQTLGGAVHVRTEPKSFAESAEQASSEGKKGKAIFYSVLARPKELAKSIYEFVKAPSQEEQEAVIKMTPQQTREVIKGVPGVVLGGVVGTFAYVYEKPELAVPRIGTDIVLTYGLVKGINYGYKSYVEYKFEQNIKVPSEGKFYKKQPGLPVVEPDSGAVLSGRQQQIVPKDVDVYQGLVKARVSDVPYPSGRQSRFSSVVEVGGEKPMSAESLRQIAVERYGTSVSSEVQTKLVTGDKKVYLDVSELGLDRKLKPLVSYGVYEGDVIVNPKGVTSLEGVSDYGAQQNIFFKESYKKGYAVALPLGVSVQEVVPITSLKVGVSTEVKSLSIVKGATSQVLQQVYSTKKKLEVVPEPVSVSKNVGVEVSVVQTPIVVEENKVVLPLRIVTEVVKPKVPFVVEPMLEKGSSSLSGFAVFVRRRGKFVPVGVESSVIGAVGKGVSLVRGSASASFKVVPVGGKRAVGEVGGLNPREFYRSRREQGVFVQRRERRISSAGEKKEITFRGLLAQRVRRPMKKGFGLNVFGGGF